jgi:hypothetical protein
MSTQVVPPIKKIPAANQQHMLLLFLPMHPAKTSDAETSFHQLFAAAAAPAAAPSDNRALTGVHFFMIYPMRADAESRIVVPTFTAAPPGTKGKKDLLVVLSIYDADFDPYISAFLADPIIVYALNGIVDSMDESGIEPDSDTSSAVYIKANKGVANNANGFFKLLMRYNFADPTVPAVGPGGVENPPKPPNPPWPYTLAATFPGLTVGMMLNPVSGYPNALQLWPAPGAAPPIFYDPSKPPG